MSKQKKRDSFFCWLWAILLGSTTPGFFLFVFFWIDTNADTAANRFYDFVEEALK